MSTSIFSPNSSVSRTTSASAFQRRERGGSKIKRPPDDGFISAYNMNCEAADLKTYPPIVASITEPTTWLAAAVAFQYEKKSILAKSSTLRVTHSSIESKSPMETRRSHHNMRTLLKTDDPEEIYAIYNDSDKEGCITALIYKHFPMEDAIMGVLQKTLIKFSTLKTLRLESCSLTPDQLKAVKFILMKCDNIVELSLDSNPLSNQNYYILLKDTKLMSLSLKLCNIDDIGAIKLASYLHYPYSQALVILDMSCNSISDDGCESLANALRTNRSLSHLLLTSNCITSIGCQKLMEVLRRFDLRHDEVLLKRKLNMDYLLRCKLAHHQNAQTLLGVGLETASQDSIKRSNSKNEKRKSSLSKNKKDKPSGTSVSSSKNSKRSKNITPSIRSFNLLVEKDPHPYIHECVHEDKKVYCRGNTKLEYLNLSHNNINYTDASEIEATLMYQISLKSDSGIIDGIVKLVLDGNPFIETVDYSRDVNVDVEKYCKMPCPIPGTVHTICEFKCQIAPNCLNFREYELDVTERKLIVQYHNEFRNRLASGNDTTGGNTNAKDMLELQYDPEIELAVSCWGRRCFFSHDACRQTLSHKTAGQNLYIHSSSVPIDVKDKTYLYECVKTWYREITNMKPQFTRQYASPPQQVIGHFTQVVWASTEFIGCTRVTWTSTVGLKYKLHILCNYSPAGNLLGRSIYARGVGCSRGLIRSPSYPSLCARRNSRRVVTSATVSPSTQPSSLRSLVPLRQTTAPTPSSTKPTKSEWHIRIVTFLILIATNVKVFFFVNIGQ